MPACRSPLAERAGIRKSEGHSVSVPLASDRGVSQTEPALQFQRCNLWWAEAYRAVWTLAGAAGGFTQSRQVDDKRGAFAWFAAHCDLASVVPVLKRASGCGPGMGQRDRLWSISARTAWDTRNWFSAGERPLPRI